MIDWSGPAPTKTDIRASCILYKFNKWKKKLWERIFFFFKLVRLKFTKIGMQFFFLTILKSKLPVLLCDFGLGAVFADKILTGPDRSYSFVQDTSLKILSRIWMLHDEESNVHYLLSRYIIRWRDNVRLRTSSAHPNKKRKKKIDKAGNLTNLFFFFFNIATDAIFLPPFTVFRTRTARIYSLRLSTKRLLFSLIV